MVHGLLVEDDCDIARALVEDFAESNFILEHFDDGALGLEAALSGKYEFVILDWMLPSILGSEVCRKIRQSDQSIPIILLTSKSRTIDKVLMLEIGADDYVTKPFVLDELLARVKAVLRRNANTVSTGKSSRVIRLGELEINLDKRTIHRDEKPIELSSREFEIVALLAQNPGTPFTKEQICEAVDGFVGVGYERALISTINRIRVRLETDPKKPQYLITARGFGYYLAEE